VERALTAVCHSRSAPRVVPWAASRGGACAGVGRTPGQPRVSRPSSPWHRCGGKLCFHGAGMPTASVDCVGGAVSHGADAMLAHMRALDLPRWTPGRREDMGDHPCPPSSQRRPRHPRGTSPHDHGVMRRRRAVSNGHRSFPHTTMPRGTATSCTVTWSYAPIPCDALQGSRPGRRRRPS
jgi:hypothetical protein